MAQTTVMQNRTLPRLEMRGICKRFGATVALDQVGFSALPGQVHALVGENGAGKSTLMKILSGAYRADAGEMYLDGRLFQPHNPLEARRQGIGMIYQELSLAPHLTVAENILLGLEPNRWGLLRLREIRQRALRAIQEFEHPEIKPEIRVDHLSVSAQQLVEIGRALAIGCRVLVFDEPTSSLSQRDMKRLFDIIRRLKQQNISIVYISHFLEEVQQIADCLTVLRDGTVVGTQEVGRMSIDAVVRMMVGREIHDLYPRSQRQPGASVLEITNLSGLKKPESASLVLYRGEILGICGLLGAGRTELLRVIFGLDAVRSGKLKVGLYQGPASPARRWAQGLGLLSENRKEEGLTLNQSIADNVTLSKLSGFGPLGWIVPQRQRQATQVWIQALEIRCRESGQRVQELSGGNQQKVALARLLHHDVDVMLLDEPTRGIDVAAKAKIYQVINALATGSESESRAPKAILIVSSYLPELLGICDRIAVMCRGRLGPAKPVADLDEHKLMLAATGQGAWE